MGGKGVKRKANKPSLSSREQSNGQKEVKEASKRRKMASTEGAPCLGAEVEAGNGGERRKEGGKKGKNHHQAAHVRRWRSTGALRINRPKREGGKPCALLRLARVSAVGGEGAGDERWESLQPWEDAPVCSRVHRAQRAGEAGGISGTQTPNAEKSRHREA